MNARFNIHKATEVACQFLQRENGRINIMKLIKLFYILDRLSIERRELPVVGGEYYSMKNGPVTGEVLDLVNAGSIAGEPECLWGEYVTDRENHEISLQGDPPLELLSGYEIDLIDEVYKEHGSKDQWQLRNWCHENCGEWTPLESGRTEIGLMSICEQQGKSPEEIKRIVDQTLESDRIASILIK